MSDNASVTKSEKEHGETGSLEYLQYKAPAHDPKAVKRLLWKLDGVFVTLTFLVYTFAFCDRAAIGNAGIAGFKPDLHLVGLQYNAGLSIFFVGYILSQMPSNLMLKKVGPKYWLSFLVFLFSMITISTAFIKNYSQYCAVRFLLGAAEGGVLSGQALLLSLYYTREELIVRIYYYMIAASSSGAFGGLLAYGLIQIGKKGVFFPWSWIFFVEGLISFVLAICVLVIVPRDPTKIWFLNASEQQIQNERMKEINGGADKVEKTTFKLVKQAWTNPLYILVGFIYFTTSFMVQSIAIFTPTILNSLGFSVLQSEIHSVYPNILGTGVTMAAVYASRATNKVGVYILASYPIAATGFGVLLSNNLTVAYAELYVACVGVFVGGILCMAWNAKNAAPETVRAIAIAMGPTIGHTGAICSSWAYRAQDAPRYHLGNALNMVAGLVGFVLVGITMAYITWENKQRAAGKRDHRLTGNFDEDAKLGSLHPRYRYMI